MHVAVVAAATESLSFFRQRSLLVDVGCIRVEVFDAFSHHDALGVLPRTFADAIACVDAGVAARCRRAQIGAPVGAGRASRLCKRRAVSVGTIETAEVGAIAL